MEEKEYSSRLAQAIGDVLYFRANEPILIRKFEEFMSPKPARLAADDDEKTKLNKRLDELSVTLGGVPGVLIASNDQPNHTKYDEYGVATLDEIISYFNRCRDSVVKAHLSFVAYHFIRERPDFMNIEPEYRETMTELMEEAFWEETEIAYIRLASYWDRVGQLLDFMFFNVRQYERDGFAAVVDKIHGNFSPIYPELRISESYQKLRSFQQSEQIESFKWLARRRNLLVHSIRLRKLFDQQPNVILEFAFNHLEDKYRSKLQVRDPSDELNTIHQHLSNCAGLFPDVLELSKLAINLKIHVFVNRPGP